MNPQSAGGDEQVLGYAPPAPLSSDAARPSDLTAEAAPDGSVVLTWVDNSANERGFIIRRYDSTGLWTDYAVVEADVTTYTDSAVEAKKTYCYKVVAYDEQSTGVSAQRCVRAAAPLSPGAPTSENVTGTSSDPPISPSDLSAAASGPGQITLTWTDNSADESGFVVRRYNGRAGWQEIGQTLQNVTSFVDATVPAGQSCCYQVAASRDAMLSRYSTTACAKADSAGVPEIPEVPQIEEPATPPTAASLSGQVLAGGAPLRGVLLAVTGVPGSFATDAQGRFSIEVPLGWSGVMSASAEGYRFSPCQSVYSNVLMHVPGQDFSAQAIPYPQETVLARTEAELRQAEVIARNREITILIDREISLERGLSFGTRNYGVCLRGTTASAGIRFTRRWDGNWSGDAAAENGLEFATPYARLQSLRITGYEWKGSAVKFHGQDLLYIEGCTFQDISTLAYPTKTGQPTTTSEDVWFGNAIGGCAGANLIVSRCTFNRVATSDVYAHCIYPSQARQIFVSDCVFSASGQPVVTWGDQVRLTGNTYRDTVRVPTARYPDSPPVWNYWLEPTSSRTLVATGETFINATFRWPIRYAADRARHYFEANNYGGLRIEGDIAGPGKWLPPASSGQPGMNWADWRRAGFDQASLPPANP